MITITFVTGNALKAAIAKDILSRYGVAVTQKKIPLSEIQADNGKEVSEASAREAARIIGGSVVKTDVSYSIPALNGFPGPYVKYINKWLSAQDLLRLLDGHNDRTLIITEYLTCADADGAVRTFETRSHCRIATRIVDDTRGSTFDKLVIREGFDVPQNLLSDEQLQKIFHEGVRVWHDLGEHLRGST